MIAARDNDVPGPKTAKNRPNRPGKNGNVPPAEHQFKNGNPGGGRPKGTSLTDKLRKVLDEPDDDYATKADKLIAEAVKAAGNGDVRYFKEIFERIDGKVPDHLGNVPGEKFIIEVRRVGRANRSD